LVPTGVNLGWGERGTLIFQLMPPPGFHGKKTVPEDRFTLSLLSHRHIINVMISRKHRFSTRVTRPRPSDGSVENPIHWRWRESRMRITRARGNVKVCFAVVLPNDIILSPFHGIFLIFRGPIFCHGGTSSELSSLVIAFFFRDIRCSNGRFRKGWLCHRSFP